MFRRILESLRRKYGPLPLWAWTAIAGGVVFLWNRTRRAPAEVEAAAPAISEPAFAYGAEPDFGDTGPGPVGAVGPVEEAGGPGEFYPDNKLREATMELVDQIRGYTEDVEAARGFPLEGGEEVVYPDETPAPQPSPTGQPERGVRWGGRVFKTKGALAQWLAAHRGEGADPGRAFRRWAQRHPGAAAKLGGKAPKPKPRPKPAAVKAPSKRTPAREPAKGGRGAGGARARSPQPKPQPKPAARPRPQAQRGPAPKPQPKPKPKPKRRQLIPRRGQTRGL